MPDETRSTRLALIAVSCGVAIVTGMLFGWLSKSAGWGFGALVVAVGVLVGMVAVAFGRIGFIERVTVGTIASAVGIGLFAWTSGLPAWRAEVAVADTELDDLCIRVTALQLCHQRQIMGVFDFKDVPAAVRSEARQTVTQMPHAEKLALCNRIFGKRINGGQGASTSVSGGLIRGSWVLLTLSASAVPNLLRRRSVGS